MKNVYEILEAIEDHFVNEEKNTNAVRFGDLDKVDLNKTTLFPLAHFNIANINYSGNTVGFIIDIMCLDIVDESKEYDGSFAGATNLQDVLNTQAMVVNKLIESIRVQRGSFSALKYEVVNNPVADYVQERFENKLAGWAMSIEIDTPNILEVCPT